MTFSTGPMLSRWLIPGLLALAATTLGLWGGYGGMDGTQAHALLARLQIVPVLAAGLLLGWRWGLALGVSAAASVLVGSMIAQAALGAVPDREFLFWLDLSLLATAGIVTGLLSSRHHRDTTEHRKLAAQLRKAHADMRDTFEGMKRAERLFAVGQLSAGLAHEIRNPLASISGAAGILRRNASTSSQHAELLEIIERECLRLNGMLTNFLEFAKPKPPQPKETDIATVLDRVISLASHAPRRWNILIRKHLAAGVPPVVVDPEQLQQVLLNMVMNAVQASSDGDEVVLAAWTDAKRLWVDVRDQGSGVKPEHTDRLFDPFFTTKEHGTGLGLPVAHEIVRSIGGILKVSHNEGRGMTFSVGLPLAQGPESHE